jgi:uncharacterized repeat protein (TIGR01451 family)
MEELMYKRIIWIAAVFFISFGALAGLVWAATETEPNNDSSTANLLFPDTSMTGAITPVGDLDYYALNGVNTTWGFIALLETTGDATLTALGSDGTTVLQSNTSAWEQGTGIALQNYANGSDTHYLRVNENGDNATVPTYTLRYYRTIIASQPEVEPNETAASGTPSAFTHEGVLSSTSDIDCFAFDGRAADTILLAVDNDAASPANIDLELRDAANTVLQTADHTGVGGDEFLEYTDLPASGVYAYCVKVTGGSGGPTASYRAGLVRNGGLYFPSYQYKTTWLNPRSGNVALVGDTLTFRLAVTNTSPITIPDDVNLSATYPSGCLTFSGGNPTPTYQYAGHAEWYGLRPDGLAPGETFSVTVDLGAVSGCTDFIRQNTGLSYYLTGTASDTSFKVLTDTVYLPTILRP